MSNSGGITTKTLQPEAVTVAAKAAAPMFSLSIRSWRRHDSSGRIPRGFKIVGRKVWRVSDLERWAQWEFPSRAEFEKRLAVETNEKGGRNGS